MSAIWILLGLLFVASFWLRTGIAAPSVQCEEIDIIRSDCVEYLGLTAKALVPLPAGQEGIDCELITTRCYQLTGVALECALEPCQMFVTLQIFDFSGWKLGPAEPTSCNTVCGGQPGLAVGCNSLQTSALKTLSLTVSLLYQLGKYEEMYARLFRRSEAVETFNPGGASANSTTATIFYRTRNAATVNCNSQMPLALCCCSSDPEGCDLPTAPQHYKPWP